jgi:hypothetical protein
MHRLQCHALPRSNRLCLSRLHSNNRTSGNTSPGSLTASLMPAQTAVKEASGGWSHLYQRAPASGIGRRPRQHNDELPLEKGRMMRHQFIRASQDICIVGDCQCHAVSTLEYDLTLRVHTTTMCLDLRLFLLLRSIKSRIL